MLYKANSENKVTNEATFIEAGIVEPLVLDRIESKESKNGNKFLAFYFKNKSDSEVSKTEWEPKLRQGEDEKVLQGKADNLMSRLNHMLVDSGILQESEFNFEFNSFEELGQKLISLVIDSGKHKDKEIRAKVVYDNNGYTTLPNYTKYTWIESTSIPKEESKIGILSIDQMERVKADETSSANSNPFIEDSPEINKEDDPFAQAA